MLFYSDAEPLKHVPFSLGLQWHYVCVGVGL